MQNLCDHIPAVEGKIGYGFNNQDLLLQAFTRSSYSAQFGGENNEVLEFIGDRAIDFYVIKVFAEWFGFFKSESDYYDENEDDDEFCIIANKDEADFTELKRSIVSNENLAKIIDNLKLAKFMYLGDTDINNNVVNNVKAKADLLEAIVGAVAVDCDWDPNTMQDVIINLLDLENVLDDVDTEEKRPAKFQLENSINTLKELAEHGACSIPEYHFSDEPTIDEDGWQRWECECYVRSWGISQSVLATSKKEAKRYAAYLVLCERYDLPNEYGGEEE